MSGFYTGFTFPQGTGGGGASLTNTQIGFGSGANTLTGAATLTYDSATGVLTSSLGDLLINGLTIGRGPGNVASNVTVGNGALAANTTGSANIAIGTSALALSSTGASNIAIGRQALSAMTSGNSNTAVGSNALQRMTTGVANNAFGNAALLNNLTGQNNAAFGNSALNGATGSGNAAFGCFTGQSMSTGSNTTLLGFSAGNGLTTGSANTFVGANSGRGVTGGNNNAILGSYQGATVPISATGSQFVVLSDGTGQVDCYWDSTKTMYLQGPVSATGSVGTSGQVLTSAGAGLPPTWTSAAGGSLTLASSATNASFYLPFATVQSGSVSNMYTNTQLFINPSTSNLNTWTLTTSGSTGYVVNSTGANAAGNIGFKINNQGSGATAYADLYISGGTTSAQFRVNSQGFTSGGTFGTQPTEVVLNSLGNALTLTTNGSLLGGINLVYSSSVNKAHTINPNGSIGLGATPLVAGNTGTAGQVLTSAGSGAPVYWSSPSGVGTVTSVSVVNANGFNGTVATATSTPAITISTTVTGILQGNGTAISAATTTGTGNVVLSTNASMTTPTITSPTLVTPILGTPTSGTLTNCVGLPLATGVTGVLPIANGGTGLSTVGASGTVLTSNGTSLVYSAAPASSAISGGAAGQVLYQSATATTAFTATGTTGQSLLSGGTGAPTWGTPAVATNLAGGSAYAIPYQSAANTTAFLAAGTSGQVLTSQGAGLPPIWAAGGGGSTLTATYVGYGAAGNTLTGTAGMTFNSTTNALTTTGDSYFGATGTTGVRVGTGNTAAANRNVVVGSNSSGAALTTGTLNTFVGAQAGNTLYSGTANTAIGANTLAAAGSNSYNTAVGYAALNVVGSGQNVAVGDSAGLLLSSGGSNTFIGSQSGKNNITGVNNVALGANSFLCASSASGSNNTSLGYNTGQSITSGNLNTFVGNSSGGALTTGTANTFVGYSSGNAVTTGNYNTLIGGYTGSALPVNAIGSNYIALSDGQANVPVYWYGLTNRQYNNGIIYFNNAQNNINPNTSLQNGVFGLSNTGTTQAIAYMDSNYNVVIGDYTKTGSDTWIESGRDIFIGPNGSNSTTQSNASKFASNGTFFLNCTALPSGLTTSGILIASTTGDMATWKSTGSGNNGLNLWQTGTTTNNMMAFQKGASQTQIGSISCTTTGTTYVTTSDYRIKKNVVPMENGLDRVLALRAVAFDFDHPEIEHEPEDVHSEGFIAHEVQAVFPYAVTGEKDAVNADGTLKVQSVDYGRLTPLLVKAIQEQQAIIEALQARLDKAGL